jgi:hypothetical protein
MQANVRQSLFSSEFGEAHASMAQPEPAAIVQMETDQRKPGMEEHNYPGKYSAAIEEADDDPREIALKEKTQANADKPLAVPENAPTERKNQHVSFTTRLD